MLSKEWLAEILHSIGIQMEQRQTCRGRKKKRKSNLANFKEKDGKDLKGRKDKNC